VKNWALEVGFYEITSKHLIERQFCVGIGVVCNYIGLNTSPHRKGSSFESIKCGLRI
jgi:hypothetical protein